MNPLLWQIAIDMASAEAQKSAKVAADVAAAPPPAAPAAPMPAGDPGMGGGDPSAGGDPMATIVPIIRQIVTEVMTQQGGGAAGGKPGMPGKKSGPAELMAALEEQGRKVDYLVTLKIHWIHSSQFSYIVPSVLYRNSPTLHDVTYIICCSITCHQCRL
jgi:hypothetical protein